MRPGSTRMGVALVASSLVLALGAAPLFVRGADHLDAPGLSSPEGRSVADILDLYVFEGENPNRTAIAMTTHPGAGAISPLRYAGDVLYQINVDRNGDAIEDLAYVMEFGPKRNGRQTWVLTRYRGEEARRLRSGRVLGRGVTNRRTLVRGGTWAFAGLRSDPFFLDLDALLDDVFGQPRGRDFCDGPGGTGTDFFEPLNANAIVIEVPDSKLGGDIGVWATTADRDGQIDRVGRPAINTVFNGGAEKNAFNVGRPRDDLDVFGGNVADVLDTFSALDSEGAYSMSTNDALVGTLLPDVLTYDTSTPAAGPLNGRALADDVIDVELNLVTGGFDDGTRDGVGAITTDCVGPHTDYRARFPYLGKPN